MSKRTIGVIGVITVSYTHLLPVVMRVKTSSDRTSSSGLFFWSQTDLGHWQNLQYLDLEK